MSFENHGKKIAFLKTNVPMEDDYFLYNNKGHLSGQSFFNRISRLLITQAWNLYSHPTRKTPSEINALFRIFKN